MSYIYLIEGLGLITGPVELPPIPGFGTQLPANGLALDEQLPEPKRNHVWVLLDGTPQQLECHLGTAYEVDTGAPVEWDQLGPLPEYLTDLQRPSTDYHWKDGRWSLDPEAVYSAKVREINRECEAGITGSFQSDALGQPHQYSSQLDDQLNLTGAIVRGLDMPYACRDVQGVKAFRLHTFVQLRQVGDDFTVFKLQLLQKANELKQQLDQALAAGDLAALEAVTWEREQ